jgi:hypothetical protein
VLVNQACEELKSASQMLMAFAFLRDIAFNVSLAQDPLYLYNWAD